MAPDALAFTLAQCIFFLVAIVVRERCYAPKRLTPAELVGQARLVRGLIARALRGKATREDVKDLAQDVLLAAWEASGEDRYRPDPDVEPARALAGWLRRLAFHRITHHLESARVRHEEVVADPPVAAPSRPDVEQAVERQEMRVLLLEALRELPEHESAVIVAHDLYEMSMDEAAEQQDAPRSTAYRWRARGIDALTRALRARRG